MDRSTLRKPLTVCAVLILAAILWAGNPKDASATVIYTYTGNNFNAIIGSTFNSTNQITGSFTVPGVLFSSPYFPPTITPSDFSFTAGTATVDASNATSLQFKIATNATGDITDWFIEVSSAVHTLLTQSPPAPNIPLDKACVNANCPGDTGFIEKSAGRWVLSTSAPIPEPSTMLLLGSGLAGLGFLGDAGSERHRAEPFIWRGNR